MIQREIAILPNRRLLHTDAFAHRRFYTQIAFTHADAFHVHTDSSLQNMDAFTHTEAFTHRGFYTQTLLHTDERFTYKIAFDMHQRLLHTRSQFYTQRPLTSQTSFYARNTFRHRGLYTQIAILHTEAFDVTDVLLHTDTFTHRCFYTTNRTFTHRGLWLHRRPFITTRRLLDTDAFTHTHQRLSHTEAFTYRLLYTSDFAFTQGRDRTNVTSQFYLSFWRFERSFCAKRLRLTPQSRNFSSGFWRPTCTILWRKGCVSWRSGGAAPALRER